MELKHIKTNKCPICGCSEVIMESVDREWNGDGILYHTNGGRWETREFACGYKVQFVPNFGHEKVRKKCSHDSDELLKKIKHRDDCDKLINFINENNIGNDVVRSVYNNLFYEVSI